MRVQWLALAAALVVLAGTLVAWALSRAAERVQVVSVAQPVQAGDVIDASDLRISEVAIDADVSGLVPATSLDRLAGRVATIDLAPGVLVSAGMWADDRELLPSERTVGAVLGAGRYPSGLAHGSSAWAIDVRDSSSRAAADGGAAEPAPPIVVRVLDAEVDDSGALRVTLAVADASAVALGASRRDGHARARRHPCGGGTVIVGVGTWRGLGATTTALGLAVRLAARGERPWLIEADPAGGLLSARSEGRGRGRRARARRLPQRSGHRHVDRFDAAAEWWNGVRVVSAPGDPFRAWACHQPRLAWASALRELDGPVIVDVGRVRGGAPIADVLGQLDVLLLTVTPDVVELVTTVEWAAQRGRCSALDVGLVVDITRIVVVDAPDRPAPASRTSVEHELGDRFAGWLPWCPSAVDLLRRGAPDTDRRLRRQPWVQSLDALVDRLRALDPAEVLA